MPVRCRQGRQRSRRTRPHRHGEQGDTVTRDLFLGIDVGSSGTRGVLVDETGRRVADEQLPHGISRPRPGWAEQDAEHDWWESAAAVSRRLVDGRSDRVAGGRRVRARAVRRGRRRGRAASAPGDPVRDRHESAGADRAADGRVGRRGHPLPLRLAAHEPVGRPQASLAGRRGAAGVGGDAARVRFRLVPRRATHRRVRARPPQRRSLGSSVRRRAQRVDPGLGRTGRTRSPPADGSSGRTRPAAG